MNLVSAQLNRLTQLGIVEKVKSGSGKRAAFQVSERFFNIWYLMRASQRAQHKLVWLVEFLGITAIFSSHGRGWLLPPMLSSLGMKFTGASGETQNGAGTSYCKPWTTAARTTLAATAGNTADGRESGNPAGRGTRSQTGLEVLTRIAPNLLIPTDLR